MSQNNWYKWFHQYLFNAATQCAWGLLLSLSVRNKTMRLNGRLPVYLSIVFWFSFKGDSWKYTHKKEVTRKSIPSLIPYILVRSYFALSIRSWIDSIFGAYKRLLVVYSSDATCRRLWAPVRVSVSITLANELQNTEILLLSLFLQQLNFRMSVKNLHCR